MGLAARGQHGHPACRLRRLSGSQPAVRSYPVRAELRKYQCVCVWPKQNDAKSVNARATRLLKRPLNRAIRFERIRRGPRLLHLHPRANPLTSFHVNPFRRSPEPSAALMPEQTLLCGANPSRPPLPRLDQTQDPLPNPAGYSAGISSGLAFHQRLDARAT